MGKEANIVFIVSCLLLTFIVLHIDHYTVEADDNRTSLLSVTICHGEELTLTDGLSATNID